MVFCCVPKCGTDSWSCDPSITFHDFPSSPDIAAKWIKQINIAIKTNPMWYPRGRAVICSKHFLQTDFKDNTDALKPKCIPTIFGHKFIGENPEINRSTKELTRNPLIVKVMSPAGLIENHSPNEISTVHSQLSATNVNKTYADPFKVQTIFHRSLLQNNPVSNSQTNNTASKQTVSGPSKQVKFLNDNGNPKNGIKRNSDEPSKIFARKREKTNNDLIEIGPNTFLKINPDIIKVNKKLTPSGNTVLQFLMDQKVANSQSGNLLPTIVHGPLPEQDKDNNNLNNGTSVESTSNYEINKISKTADFGNQSNFQHVLGHLIDTHECKDSCSGLNDGDDSMNDDNSDNQVIVDENSKAEDKNNGSYKSTNKGKLSFNTDSSVLEKAPVLLTTKMPISHCFNDKPKYLMQIKQKSRQIASLKFKISNLTKKIEELEDRCIVQERQLSYSFIKRLKTIRKNSGKGDPTATYILEQIRSYTNNSKMRWSDSTLAQCAIWCRKAPYAYEYFKKAELFKLPCLGTVKRFMKKHPDVNTLKKIMPNPQGDDESSSDFDFDEDNDKGLSDDENEEPVGCETVLSEVSNTETSKVTGNQLEIYTQDNAKVSNDVQNMTNQQNEPNNLPKENESNSIPLTVDNSSMEIQEIMLPSGEIVQCYSSSIGNSGDGQYYIIPNVSDPNSVGDHEYSVVQADSLPVLLQNIDQSQHQEQQQLIFITNQVQCSETEVSTV